MKIKTVKISGFKPIPFCAAYTPEEKNVLPRIDWQKNLFHLSLAQQPPLISAIVGPNSSGKSSVFYALEKFFGSVRKLDLEHFNNKQTEQPVILEVTFSGIIPSVEQWHLENCQVKNPNVGQVSDGELIITAVFTGGEDSGRTDYIRKPNGELRKAGANDSKVYKALLPKYRLISADSRLGEQANPEKSDLMTDLIEDVLASAQRSDSAVSQIRQKVAELQSLVVRETSDSGAAWREIEELEGKISDSLSPITSTNPHVHLQIQQNVPEAKSLFLQGKIHIEDGVELTFSQHGLGIQRSFIASVLHVWCERIGHKQDYQDYTFAIEEPELYLHPHATRAFIKTLEEIAQHDQVLFTTHCSEFVNRVPLDNVIRLLRQQNIRRVIQPDLSLLSKDIKSKIQRYLRENRSDMLFARTALLVEGQTEFFAIPGFCSTMGLDPDKAGISIVWVEGKENFEAYHHILDAFQIPHVILGDGDGERTKHETKYGNWVGENSRFVLENDFETALLAILPYGRQVEILNKCRRERGQSDLPDKAEITSKSFEKIGKPLAGRVAGEILEKKEIEQIPEIANTLQQVFSMAGKEC